MVSGTQNLLKLVWSLVGWVLANGDSMLKPTSTPNEKLMDEMRSVRNQNVAMVFYFELCSTPSQVRCHLKWNIELGSTFASSVSMSVIIFFFLNPSYFSQGLAQSHSQFQYARIPGVRVENCQIS
jgi:hypothetical protein